MIRKADTRQSEAQAIDRARRPSAQRQRPRRNRRKPPDTGA